MRPAFHLAFPVRDLDETRRFYVDLLGCREGRSADRWVDLDFFGHQISAHLVDDPLTAGAERSSPAGTDSPRGEEAAPRTNDVDGDDVPVRHFGVILGWEAFDQVAARLQEALPQAGRRFRIAPRLRFAGEPGEQKTMFFDDPSGNAIEMKAFRDESHIFRTG